MKRKNSDDLCVFMVALSMSRETTGEAFSAYRWAESLSREVKLTVATLQRADHTPLSAQLPNAEIVAWPEPELFKSFPRFTAMVKPGWIALARHVKAFLRREAGRFDIAHQIMPQAMRYATPLRGHGLPYVIGPVGGALDTPQGFEAEIAGAPWFTRLRALDKLRFRYDPWLRGSYSGAAALLGVAPYVREVLRDVPLQRYENVLEFGIDSLPARPARSNGPGLRLLHVGRGVRTKGLRDVIRALALLSDRPEITLVSAGDGEEIPLCHMEAERLGVADRVTFLRHVSRARVEELYAEADVFAFPSFREPAGNVVYEAMRWGLPMIVADRGGPGHIVDATCGFKIDVVNPQQFANDLASAIRRLADDPALRARLGEAARNKVESEGMWQKKADNMIRLYSEILSGKAE